MTKKTPIIEDAYPLSPTQQGLLFHSLDADEPGLYVNQFSCTLNGPVDLARLKQAWQQVVERHSILRTSFHWKRYKHPIQVVHRQVNCPWTMQDWRSHPPDQQAEALARFLERDRHQGFNLSKPPLMRVSVIQLAEQHYQFIWTQHHLILDGWSSRLVLQDVFETYEALLHKEGRSRPSARSFKHYIAWLQQQDLSHAQAFWQERLRGFTTPTQLQIVRLAGHPQARSEGYKTHTIQISQTVTDALHTLAQRHRLTVNTLVQGAFALLLSCYSREYDVVFGATYSGRPAELTGVEGMVGLFINTLPVRIQIQPNESLLSWLQMLQAQHLDTQPFEHTPLSQVQTWSEVPSGTSLFEILFVFENYPVDPSLSQHAEHLKVDNSSSIESTNYPLTVTVGLHSTLSVTFSYDSERYTPEAIAQMGEHFQQLLFSITANPIQRLSELNLLTPSEHQHLHQWNQTQSEIPDPPLLLSWIEAQVEQTPDAIALVFQDQQLTYRELNQRANQLAYELRSYGVGSEVLVGLCLERSPEMVIALLAVLKAGGAYVPLDPSYPPERLSFMLQDANVSLLLTQARLKERLPASTPQVLCLDRDWEAIAQHRSDNPVSLTHPDDLIYVIYTSGSTGRPKGAMNNHRALANRLHWMQTTYHLTNTDIVLQKTPFSFDVSVWEFFWPLMSGAKLVLAEPEGHRDSAYLVRLIQAQQVSTLHFVPSMLRPFLIEPQVDCTSLKRILCSGEALPPDLAKQVFERFQNTELHNLYGPTEAAIDVTAWKCQPQDDTVPIGKPIANIDLYILDAQGQQVPIGVPGELHIGGIGLARGYLKRPDLTAERFIPHPFSAQPGARLYKTGDLARYRPDGAIEYLGRIDFQVKLRGLRIELGEIDSLLQQHPQVKQAVVTVQESASGAQQLVAYVVPNEIAQDLETTWRQWLQENLPEYMVPTAWVRLEELPLSANGKLDRRALPVPKASLLKGDIFVAPRTDTEVTLAQIWAEVLRVESIGIHNNFFELGGDSILSLQIIARAHQAELHLTPKQIFQHPTIAQLAVIAVSTQLPARPQGIITGDVPLTPIQRWFFEQQIPDPHHFNQVVMVTIKPPLRMSFLSQAIQQLLHHHDGLRSHFTQTSTGWQQTIMLPENTSPIVHLDLSTCDSEQHADLIEHAARQLQASLDLTTGPVMRVAVFDCGSEHPARLLVILHHLVVDGVSWRILLEDLQTLYQQLLHGQSPQLPAKTTSFQHWAHQLCDYARSSTLNHELNTWLHLLSGPVSSLPVDYPDGHNTNASAETVSVVLSATDTQSLLQTVPAAYRTQISEVLLTAIAQGLAQWSGRSHWLIDLEGHGREDLFGEVDLSRTVGWFTSLFPVRLTLEANTTPGEALKAIKEQLRQVPRHGIGYGLLRYLGTSQTAQAALSALPQASILFNYLGQVDQTFEASTLFALATESTGQNRSLRQRRSHLLDINAIVMDGQLQIDWTFSRLIHQRSTIESLSQRCLQALHALIHHCLQPEAGGVTPSDFPLAFLSQRQLDRLVRQFSDSASLQGHEIDDIYPLAPLQQGMLFHSLYAPHAGVYVEQTRFELEGDLQSAELKQAWERLISRHAVLRTAFWQETETPVQVVLRQVSLPWQELDWRSLDSSSQQQQLSDLLHADLAQGFALDRAPLMRLFLIRLGDRACQLIWSYHHLLLDGWSVHQLFKELAEEYQSLSQSEVLARPPIRPYRDYLAWLQQQDHAVAESHWRTLLRGFTTPTRLWIDQGVSSTSEPHQHSIKLSTATTTALQQMAQRQQVTLNTLVQGAWAFVLSAYSGEVDITFGVTVSGRPTELTGAETMVGLFINTVPLRVWVPTQGAIASWLQQIQQQQVENQPYAHTPLVDIQRWSDVTPGTPLFETLLVFENYPIDPSLQQQIGDLEIRGVEIQEQTHYPLTLIAGVDTQLWLTLLYDAARFEDEAIARLMADVEQVLTVLADQAIEDLADISLVSSRKPEVNLDVSLQIEQAVNRLLHEQFEAIATQYPDRVALVHGEHQLTYGDLNQRADHLAEVLRSQGVGPEVLVGLCMERSLELVIGLLAILKAGGAYVPIDPSYPSDRLQFMLQDAQLSLLVTQLHLKDTLSDIPITRVVIDTMGQIDTMDQATVQRGPLSLSPSTCSATPNNAAYVIYTSGSTGRPKGVVVTHANVTRLLSKTQPWFQFKTEEVWTLFHSYAFDFSVWELWGALVYGGRLVVVPYWTSRSPDEFYTLLQTEQVTVLNQTPSAFQPLVQIDAKKASQTLALCWVIFGGEALEFSSLAPWMQRHGDRAPQCVNMYGITETTVHVTHRPISTSDVENPSRGIGQAIPDLQVYVLDRALRPVPVGVAGELYVGGAGVARGYLQRPALTAERFIPDPFSPVPGARLYKTGDLARYHPNGELEYVGRADHQVKLRGFRIELGEIESAIASFPILQQTVVLVQPTAANDQQIVAYVVTATPDPLDKDALREFLKERLPDYMIPSVLVQLESMPLTPNGKLDRRALPSPDQQQATVSRPPRTPTEAAIATVWQAVLNQPSIGIDDHFFERGGHSLLATQAIARLRETFQLDIPLRAIFEQPTVTELATYIDRVCVMQQLQTVDDPQAIAPEREEIEL